MIKAWTDVAWEDYVRWQSQDRKTLNRINKLIEAIDHNPFEGIGKPEPLRFELTGLWSRRINQCNRIIYEATEDTVLFHSCRDHYTKYHPRHQPLSVTKPTVGFVTLRG